LLKLLYQQAIIDELFLDLFVNIDSVVVLIPLIRR